MVLVAAKFVLKEGKLVQKLVRSAYKNRKKWHAASDWLHLHVGGSKKGTVISEKKRFMYQFTMAAFAIFMVSSVSTHGAFFETGGAVSYAGYVGPGDLQRAWSFEQLVASEDTDFLIATGSSTQNAGTQAALRTTEAEHIVKPGETLSTIAQWYNLSNLETVMWANNITNVNQIKSGMRLKIPPFDGYSYQVQSGDSWQLIASKFNQPVNQIAADNNNLLRAGDTIFIRDDAFTVTEIKETLIASNTPQPTTTVVASPVLDIPATSGPVTVPVEATPVEQPVGTAPVVNAVDAPAPTVNATPVDAGVAVSPAVKPPTQTNAALVNAGGWYDPLNGVKARLTQGYHGGHRAVDLALRGGTGIYAAAGGKVIESDCGYGGYGCKVVILHDNGYRTLYAHLVKKSSYKKGDRVERGAYLEWMGTTGRSTGVHLHFEIVDPKGVKVNPLGIIF